ncbi:MAG TPA: GAF domain-containing protein [Xanthobacteraceae bacterium]|nr:GAF domain-containing protein [Xanthobacteraceae bacterium]
MADCLNHRSPGGDAQRPLERLLSAILEMTGASLGNVQLMDWHTGRLTIASQRGFSKSFLDHFHTVFVRDGSACGRAIRDRRPIIIEDVMLDCEFAPHRKIADEAGFRAVQSTPLISTSGAFLGVVSTHFSAPHRPTAGEMLAVGCAADAEANAIIARRANGPSDPQGWQNADRKRIANSIASLVSSYELLRRIEQN